MSYNRVVLLGNHTRDPEMRYTPKGTAVAQFTLAVNRKWKAEDGSEKDEVSFVDCNAWGRSAEVVVQWFHKGDPMLLEGRLKQETWEDKNTHQRRSAIKVVMESFSFVGSKRGGGAAPSAGVAEPAPARRLGARDTAAAGAAAEGPAAEQEPDDIPF